MGILRQAIERYLKASDRGEVTSVLQRCNAPPAAHDSRVLRSLRSSSSAFNGWERDSPKGLYPIALFGKLDCISGDSLEGSQLRDDPSRNLSATLISHNHSRAHQQLTI